jgi:hypothetical protein
MYHFVNAGLYDALFVMQDIETETLWNHITGEALHGALLGQRLPISNLLQLSVRQALAMDPKTQVAISNRPFSGGTPRFDPSNPNAALAPMFTKTLGEEDLRRPRMDVGIGLWNGTTRRYYPLESIRKKGNALIDNIDGHRVLIYIEPETATPAALFVDASGLSWKGNEIHLDNGAVVRSGLLFSARGKRREVKRPQQIFTRWYGFALTFPGCEIFGQ